MVYGQIRKLLSENFYDPDEIVLIESSFHETTRGGKALRTVVLGLTNKNIAIASMVYKIQNNNGGRSKYTKNLKMCYQYPLNLIKIHVFKQHIRQSLKMVTSYGIRYFQIADTPNKMVYWHIWCNYTRELHSQSLIWPFCNKSSFEDLQQKRWLDKNLYLGCKREIENINRPIPIPGLGYTEEMKISYVMPLFYGCWNSSEDWTQFCNNKNKNVKFLITDM